MLLPHLDPDVGPGLAGTSRCLGAGRAMWPSAVHELDRALVADRVVGSFFVVVSTPSLAFSAGVIEGEEPDRVQAFGPDLAVERLGERVVRRLAVTGTIEVLDWWLREQPGIGMDDVARLLDRLVIAPLGGQPAAQSANRE